MCGIFGAIGDATDGMLSAARAALAHRGPDSDGAWRDGTTGLAHTRLKIIDLSPAAGQPMPGCDGQVQVTFNGEIFNHHELRRELEARGHRFRSRGDTEAIVHGYEEWGPAVVERLDGQFAFGLWDARARRLLCARDRTGKKPLFYTLSPDGSVFHFASEVKALTAAGHPDALDRQALPMFLSWGYVPAPRTLHAGVAQLAPASRLIYSAATRALTVEEYWRPTFLDPPVADSFADARARVRELVIAAVERRLESDVPLGAFLSGGVDSTIVVGVMTRLLGRRVRSFSIGFHGDPRFDETDYAREAAAALGSDHTELKLDPTSVDAIERLVWLHDGPFTDSSAIPTEAISRQMKQHVTVALSGDGGDELFAGYLRFLAAEAAERIPRPLRRALTRVGALIPGGLQHHSLGARARRFLVAADLSLPDRLSRWNSAFAFELPGLLRPEVARGLDLDAPAAWQRGFFDGPGTPLARILDHNFRTYLAYDLQTKVDRCSAGSAFEVRSPFLDTALVEYAGRLPDGFKRRGPRTKHILREAFKDLLPPRIARRGKMGFAVPLAAWFRSGLRDYVRDTLRPGARVHELIDPRATAALVEEHLSTRADRSAQIWTLLTLEIWLRALASQSLEKPRTVKHAFTIDLEDWYHGIPIAPERKAAAERRLHVGTEKLLELLARNGAKATFFALSLIAREHPALLRQIAAAGHDIGSHGLSHDLIYEMSPERFREETRSSVRDLEDCIGKPVRSYRAAYFSITRRSLWALDILAGEGIRFDSSIFPVKNWRYGIPDYSRKPTVVETEHGPLLEFPLSTRRLWGRNIPTTGGAYFRIYPYAITRANMRSSEREGMPVVFYLHPWELDPKHPLVAFKKKAMVTHYANLRSTEPKLERLLADFRFTTLGEVLNDAFPGLGQ